MVKIVALLMFGILALYADGPVLKTGQKSVYHAGDDGTYQAGEIRSYSRNATAETVTDNVTGLIWEDQLYQIKKANGEMHENVVLDWNASKAYCENLVLAGQTDWRLPTVRELQTLINYGINPSIDTIFQNPLPDGWTQEKITIAGLTGDTAYRDPTDLTAVRCVRGNTLAKSDYIRDESTKTVYDSISHLTWQDDEDTATKYLGWSEAIDYCENLSLAGKDDWRLPNINELFMLNNSVGLGTRSLSPVFQNLSDANYWTSTTVLDSYANPDFSYKKVVAFAGFFAGLDGWASSTSGTNSVRCVRNGTLFYTQGWSLKGHYKDINVSENASQAIIGGALIVWKFIDGTWEAYSEVASIQNTLHTKNIPTFTTIKAGEGFWIYAH